jgi:hypothetical protein
MAGPTGIEHHQAPHAYACLPIPLLLSGFEPQVIGVMEAMPSSNLKPEGEDEKLVANRVYRTTYMFRCGCLLP